MHGLRRRAWWAALIGRRTIDAFLRDAALTWSAATAFYLVLSVPPLLIAFTSIAVAFVGEETARQFVTDRVTQLLPAGGSQVESIAEATLRGIGPAAFVSLAFLLVSGTRVFAALSRAINSFWSHVEKAGWVRRQLSRVLLLLAVGGIFAASVAIELAGAILGPDVSLPPVAGWIFRSQVLPNALVLVALFAIYKLLPHNAARWRSAAVGAVVGTLLLRVAQVTFTLFIQTVGDFQSAYGPMATIAILMTWALIASGAILLAAELVSVLDRRSIPGRKRRGGAPALHSETYG